MTVTLFSAIKICYHRLVQPVLLLLPYYLKTNAIISTFFTYTRVAFTKNISAFAGIKIRSSFVFAQVFFAQVFYCSTLNKSRKLGCQSSSPFR